MLLECWWEKKTSLHRQVFVKSSVYDVMLFCVIHNSVQLCPNMIFNHVHEIFYIRYITILRNSMWFNIDFVVSGVCVWVQMKHLNKGRASHSSTQAPLRPWGLWCRRSRAVERLTLRSGRIVRWENIKELWKATFIRGCKNKSVTTHLMFKVKLGLAAVAVSFCTVFGSWQPHFSAVTFVFCVDHTWQEERHIFYTHIHI